MRWLLLAICALPLVACKKVKIPRIDSEPESRAAEPAEPVEYKKHPMYVMLEAQPRDDYERALPFMLSKVINVDALQQFCGQWYPSSGRDVADAYMAWRKKHEATIKEIRGRSEAVWTSHIPPEDMAYVRMVEPHLRKQMFNAIMAEYDRSPVEKFEKVCADFPKELASSKWDLDKKYKKELAFLRQTPFTARS